MKPTSMIKKVYLSFLFHKEHNISYHFGMYETFTSNREDNLPFTSV